MPSPFHAGELAVQARAGVLEEAADLAGVVRPEISASVAAFLAGQRLAVVGAADGAGRMWASALSGEPGMLRAPDPRTLEIAAAPAPGDPLGEALAAAGARGGGLDAGVLVIDLLTRRRLRVNGRAEPAPGGGLRVHAGQVYWNCPKYIQARRVEPDPAPALDAAPAAAPRPAAALTAAQRDRIRGADTFFIATAHPRAGADVSHRGGEPGFVRVAADAGGDVLLFPDYPGNNLFNTFGNLEANPAAGLLFVDFERGGTLQLTGGAEVLWEREEFGVFPGAERAVRFRVAGALERAGAVRPRRELVARSPFNPPPPHPHPGDEGLPPTG